MDRTDSKIDTPVARGGFLSVRYVLIDKDGYPVGTYDSALEAASAAGGFWPGMGQRDEGREGWDIAATGAI